MNTKAELLIEFLQAQFNIEGDLFDKEERDNNTQTARQIFVCLAMQNEFFNTEDSNSAYESLQTYLTNSHNYHISSRMLMYMYAAALEKAEDSRRIGAKFEQAERFVQNLSIVP